MLGTTIFRYWRYKGVGLVEQTWPVSRILPASRWEVRDLGFPSDGDLGAQTGALGNESRQTGENRREPAGAELRVAVGEENHEAQRCDA